MGFDVWSRYPDGTLRNRTLTITRVKANRWDKPTWRIDGWHWERVPEFPEDVREGYKRVEFSLGVHGTLRAAKYRGEMYLRSRQGGDPRGTSNDWIKLREELEERIEILDSEVQSGFWDDVFDGKGMDILGIEFGHSADPGRDLERFSDRLRRIADRASKRRKRERRIKLLANVDGRTPEEADSYLRGAERMRARSRD